MFLGQAIYVLGPLQLAILFNVSRKTPLFSINLGRKRPMLASQSAYVLEPLHLGAVRERWHERITSFHTTELRTYQRIA
jgi:hypothetical protein